MSSPHIGPSGSNGTSAFGSPTPTSHAQLVPVDGSHKPAVRPSTASSHSAESIIDPTASSSRSRFDLQRSLQPHLSQILSGKLHNQQWNKQDKEKNRSLSRGIAEVVKEKMLEIEPKGFKYIVQVQLVENLGQGGRADLACHWEDTDTVTQEMFANDTLICTVLCFAIRT